MKQLTQKLGSGEMKIQNVPLPQINKNTILVENYYSVISAGTEGSTVSTARKSLFQKAKEKPKLVKQVLNTLKTQGPLSTFRAVNKKLDSYSPLGYSCAGKVSEIVRTHVLDEHGILIKLSRTPIEPLPGMRSHARLGPERKTPQNT